jgi:protein ImuB
VELVPITAAAPARTPAEADAPIGAPVGAEVPEPPRPLRLLPVPEPVGVVAAVPDGPPARMLWRKASYRFAKVSGPERLGAEWWRTGRRLALAPPPQAPGAPKKDGPYTPDLPLFSPEAGTRDYYVAEDEAGRRYWLFRQGLYGAQITPRWFLHGFFA